MVAVQVQNVAFARPGGEEAPILRARPVDLVHLARQTSGDRALESDILGLFCQQLATGLSQMKLARGRERMLIAHTLKGSSRLIGAFGLSRLAERIEECPEDDTLINALGDEAARVRDFIQSVCR